MWCALAAALVASAPVDDAWCARAAELLADAPATGPSAQAQLDDATALFAPTSPVAARARAVVGADGDYRAAFAVVAVAASEACNAVDDGAAASSAAALKSAIDRDARFAGVRRGDDPFDRLRRKVFLWLASLLETEGMQRFAGSTRTVFFVGVAVAALALAVRVALRMRRRAAAGVASSALVEAARIEEFVALRALAGEHLSRRDARGALVIGARALLVRAGERDARATHAASTHREVLTTLPPAVSAAVAPALGAFERALFAGDATIDDAAGFLALVDAAAARLGAAAPGGRA